MSVQAPPFTDGQAMFKPRAAAAYLGVEVWQLNEMRHWGWAKRLKKGPSRNHTALYTREALDACKERMVAEWGGES